MNSCYQKEVHGVSKMRGHRPDIFSADSEDCLLAFVSASLLHFSLLGAFCPLPSTPPFFAFVRYHQKSRPESWRFPGSPVVFMMPAGVWMYLSYKEQYYQIFQIPSSSPNANHFSPAAFSSRFIMAAPIPVLDVAVARMMVASVLSQLRRASYRFAPICS